MSTEGVRTDIPRCTWPGGWEGNLRHAVTDNIVRNKSKTHVLLAWRAGGEIQGDLWALIGGYIDPGDTAVGTVRNEAAQEGGLQKLGNIALFRIIDNPNRRSETAQNVSMVFVSEVDDPEEYGEYAVDDPDGGVQRVRWFHIDELPDEEHMAFDHYEVLQEYKRDPTTYPLSIFMSGQQQAA